MSTSVGDKIGLTVPTDQGDSGTWGAGLNTDFFLKADEAFYAAREDRNLAVIGGGKISWDGTNLSFTSNIEVYNHITAFKNIITTAGSPAAINASQKVAYVQLGRKPGSDNSITALTVVSGGSLPNGTTDADFGTFVIAYRTTDATLIIPWAKRELLNGDFWQFGTALSWYERLASRSRPGFSANSADTSQVLVPGSASAPAVVNIDGKLYANTSNATMDLDTAGRNGLDTGAKAANTIYYLYAIPPTSGRTFDLVCSITAPTTGPTGFSSWSYLGAFPTVAASAIPAFNSCNGFCYIPQLLTGVSVTNAAPATSKTLQIPSTAKAVYLRSNWTAVNAAGDDFTVGATATSADTINQATSTTPGATAVSFTWVSVLTASTVFANVTTATTDACTMNPFGWKEDPMEYR